MLALATQTSDEEPRRPSWCKTGDHAGGVGVRNLRPAARALVNSGRFRRVFRWHGACPLGSLWLRPRRAMSRGLPRTVRSTESCGITSRLFVRRPPVCATGKDSPGSWSRSFVISCGVAGSPGGAAVRFVFDAIVEGVSEIGRGDDRVVPRCRIPARGLRTQDGHVRRAGELQARRRRTPPLQASIDGAAFCPAPALKTSGVGRFSVTPTHNDPAALKSNNKARC